MLRLLVLFSLAVLVPADARSSSTSLSGETDVARPNDAVEIYDDLLAIPARDRGKLLDAYGSATQAAVWEHHLLAVLTRYPEFTDAQRDVIQDALALLTPQFFEIEASDQRWSNVVDAPLQDITARARRLFPASVARELFLDLGPRDGNRQAPAACRDPEHPTANDANHVQQRSPRPTPNTAYCECSTSSDWCDGSGIGVYYCQQGGCYFRSSGCGTFWQYACTGMCERRDDGSG
ncbi:MAG TPA: bacteriocin fulvocin C-related protein [Thermoanaerobaculia bacterium]|jgi:hypothetical protein